MAFPRRSRRLRECADLCRPRRLSPGAAPDRGNLETRRHALLILPVLESHDAVVALETGRPAPRRRDTAVVQRDDRRQRFFTRAGIARLTRGTGLSNIQLRKVWYPWADEGITRPPRGTEAPWDWLVTSRRTIR